MDYFDGCYNLEQIKTRYRQWAHKLHPDKGGDEAEFKELQSRYEPLEKTISSQPNLPDLFSNFGNYTYFGCQVKYIGCDNHYYIFDKVRGALIMIDAQHVYLIKDAYRGIEN